MATNVILKNSEGVLLYPQSTSEIILHGENSNVKAELDKIVALFGKDSLDAAKEALAALGDNYATIVDFATFIEQFFDTEEVGSAIDTWKEIEEFLKGITDSESLTGLLQELEAKILKEMPTVKQGSDGTHVTVTSETVDVKIDDETTVKLTVYTISESDIASANELANVSTIANAAAADAKQALEDVADATAAAKDAQEAAGLAAESAKAALEDVDEIKESLENYATKDELGVVNTTATAAADLAKENQAAIETLEGLVASGVYYEEIKD